jgi:hypothetical protein
MRATCAWIANFKYRRDDLSLPGVIGAARRYLDSSEESSHRPGRGLFSAMCAVSDCEGEDARSLYEQTRWPPVMVAAAAGRFSLGPAEGRRGGMRRTRDAGGASGADGSGSRGSAAEPRGSRPQARQGSALCEPDPDRCEPDPELVHGEREPSTRRTGRITVPPDPDRSRASRLTTKTPVVPRVCHDRQGQADMPQTVRTLEAAELAFWRLYGTVDNAVDGRAGIYTPAVGGSIPSAPTIVEAAAIRPVPVA